MARRILFVSVHDFECGLQVKMGRRLEACDGYSPQYVSLSRKAERLHVAQGINICCINNLMPGEGVDDSPAEVARVEAKYGVVCLREIFRADRASVGKREAALVVRTLQYFCAWENYFDKNSEVLCVIPDIGAELIRRTLYFVCRRRGIPQIFWFAKPFTNSLILVQDDVLAPPVSPEDLRVLKSEEKQEVEKFLQRFHGDTKPFVPIRYPEVSLKRLFRLFKVAYQAAVVEQGQHDSLTPLRFLRENVRRISTAQLSRLLYRKPNFDQPYVYFPLHVSNDFKISVMVPEFSDQIYVARLCAANLPVGYHLYVKEHPSFVGGERFRDLLQLAHTERIVLVPPETNNRALIQRAAAVAVISSSTGLEGLFYEKPVVTFGKPLYAGFGITHDVSDLAQTAKALKNAVSTPFTHREKLYQFLHAMMRTTYPGRPPVNLPTEENLTRVMEALRQKLKTVLKDPTCVRGEVGS